jgi:hypothetical protein
MSDQRDWQPSPDGGISGGNDEADRSGTDLGNLGGDDGPIGSRVGRDPANLGDEVPSGGDVTYPGPTDTGSGETPHM